MDYKGFITEYLKSNPIYDPQGNIIVGPVLNGGIVPLGAIYDHPLVMPEPDEDENAPGVTKEAFSLMGKMLGGISVSVESRQHHYQFRRIEKGMVVNILVFMYAPSHKSGKLMLDAMRTRCDLLLENHSFMTTNGQRAEVQWDFNIGERENHQEFMGSLVDTTRYTINGLRSKEV